MNNYQETKKLMEHVDNLCTTYNIKNEDEIQDIYVAVLEGKSDAYIAGLIEAKRNKEAEEKKCKEVKPYDINSLINDLRKKGIEVCEIPLNYTKSASNPIEKEKEKENKVTKNTYSKKPDKSVTEFLKEILPEEEFNILNAIFDLDKAKIQEYHKCDGNCEKCHNDDSATLNITEKDLLDIFKKIRIPLSFYLW